MGPQWCTRVQNGLNGSGMVAIRGVVEAIGRVGQASCAHSALRTQAARASVQTYKKGDVMVSQGDKSDQVCTLHSTPYTLRPAPCTFHPAPYTRHPAPDTLHPTPYTLHPTPYTLHPLLYTLIRIPCTLNSTHPCDLYVSPHTKQRGTKGFREAPVRTNQ